MSFGSEAAFVGRTLRALELLAVAPRSAPELADGLGVHVRTARRMLKQLEGEGYVVLGRDRRRLYRPTMRIVAVAGQVVERAELTRLAASHVRALAECLGEECHLCVPSYRSALCLVHASPSGSAACRPQFRELVPCHCTAAGKALLAWRERWRKAVLEQPLPAFTDRTITGPVWLRRELQRTVTRGFAIEDREFQDDVRGIAVPVFGQDGVVVAALGVTAPFRRLPPEAQGEVADMIYRPAKQVSITLAQHSG